ncbi:hypothetical protein NPIL_700251 [Nephila pilipes]|uniref:Uncharacterized protein n=1 Tax=Nephila pilipes TaxID=299642 RepID=A0A8X6U5P4_NEPPI|nr:hypothetical protein NPIL_700251 [Nephila pilipes]
MGRKQDRSGANYPHDPLTALITVITSETLPKCHLTNPQDMTSVVKRKCVAKSISLKCVTEEEVLHFSRNITGKRIEQEKRENKERDSFSLSLYMIQIIISFFLNVLTRGFALENYNFEKFL